MDVRKIGKGVMLSVIVSGMVTVVTTPVYAADGKAVYEKTCKLCHGGGIAGAPVAGNATAWHDRIAQGKEVLYEHAINGFRGKGLMPAKGGNKKLTDDEVKAAVDYLLQLVEK